MRTWQGQTLQLIFNNSDVVKIWLNVLNFFFVPDALDK